MNLAETIVAGRRVRDRVLSNPVIEPSHSLVRVGRTIQASPSQIDVHFAIGRDATNQRKTEADPVREPRMARHAWLRHSSAHARPGEGRRTP